MSNLLSPGSTIGILGGGQLGRMLAMAAAELGFRTHIYCDEDANPASDVASAHTVAPYDDLTALAKFADVIDVATFEFENIPTEALEFVASHTRLAPGANTLHLTRDRLVEKEFVENLGIPVAPFIDIPTDNQTDLQTLADKITFPALLKTRRFGYDGKGQSRCNSLDDLEAAVAKLDGTPAILEEMIPFEREFSIIATRAANGDILFYDLTENDHEGGILHTSSVPANSDDATIVLAREGAHKIATELDFIGTFAVEYFYLGKDAPAPLIVNEIAPRVHNTGHWTLDAAITSQFENHIRAIAGWPLGSVTRHSDAVMTNLIGDEFNSWAELAKNPDNAVHLYGKSEIRAGRKMAHVTTLESPEENLDRSSKK